MILPFPTSGFPGSLQGSCRTHLASLNIDGLFLMSCVDRIFPLFQGRVSWPDLDHLLEDLLREYVNLALVFPIPADGKGVIAEVGVAKRFRHGRCNGLPGNDSPLNPANLKGFANERERSIELG